MFKEGALIGITEGEVWFVGTIYDDHIGVSTYRPIDRDTFESMRDPDQLIEDDYGLKDLWKMAVADDRTEESYEDFAKDVIEEEKSLAYDSDFWFYGQDDGGEGRILFDDEDLREMVNEDMEDVEGIEVASWDYSSWRHIGGPYMKNTPKEWDIVYNQEVVDYLNSFRRNDLVTCVSTEEV